MANWTEGPWEIFPARAAPDDRVGVQSKLGMIVADCGPAFNVHSVANARLIAQAKVMAELLADMVEHREQGILNSNVDTTKWLRDARALLASITQAKPHD